MYQVYRLDNPSSPDTDIVLRMHGMLVEHCLRLVMTGQGQIIGHANCDKSLLASSVASLTLKIIHRAN